MKKTLTIIGLTAASLAGANAQVLFTGNYTQNFNGFGTGNVTWTDNTTLVGWSLTAEASQTLLVGGNGSDTAGQLYNFGATGNSDRSLGYVGSNGNDWSNFYLRIQNNTGGLLNSITVGYDGRLWRSGGTQTANSNNTISFFYATGTPTLVDSAVTTGWTAVAGLNYAPTVNVAAGALTGASTGLSASITGLNLSNGDSVYLRWLGNNGSGTDAGLAIDNVSVVPEPTTMTLIGLGSAFMLWNVRRRRSVQA